MSDPLSDYFKHELEETAAGAGAAAPQPQQHVNKRQRTSESSIGSTDSSFSSGPSTVEPWKVGNEPASFPAGERLETERRECLEPIPETLTKPQPEVETDGGALEPFNAIDQMFSNGEQQNGSVGLRQQLPPCSSLMSNQLAAWDGRQLPPLDRERSYGSNGSGDSQRSYQITNGPHMGELAPHYLEPNCGENYGSGDISGHARRPSQSPVPPEPETLNQAAAGSTLNLPAAGRRRPMNMQGGFRPMNMDMAPGYHQQQSVAPGYQMQGGYPQMEPHSMMNNRMFMNAGDGGWMQERVPYYSQLGGAPSLATPGNAYAMSHGMSAGANNMPAYMPHQGGAMGVGYPQQPRQAKSQQQRRLPNMPVAVETPMLPLNPDVAANALVTGSSVGPSTTPAMREVTQSACREVVEFINQHCTLGEDHRVPIKMFQEAVNSVRAETARGSLRLSYVKDVMLALGFRQARSEHRRSHYKKECFIGLKLNVEPPPPPAEAPKDPVPGASFE